MTLADEGRFEFSAVPELALIRGIPQLVPLGFYQLDWQNPWPAGDVEGASQWLSNHPTRLVDATTGVAIVTNIVSYGERSGELSYNGTWSGDVTVRIQEIGGTARSEPFRIRVLTPTVVYGDGVAALNEQKGWNARLCPRETMSFAECKSKFSGGATDVAPLVIYITQGTYSGQDWYLADRPFTYVLGNPGTRPTLANDEMSGGKKAMFYVANLTLVNLGISHSHALPGADNTLIVRNVYQCCETAQHSGIINPNTGTGADQWNVFWHQSESKGMGGTGNTQHASYVEGRPNSLFDVNNVRILGSRGSSAVKTTMGVLNVRHSLLTVAEAPNEIADGVCDVTGASTGCLMHTPIDAPGYTQVVVYANRFEMFRRTTVDVPTGRSGILAGIIFIRLRGPSLGSDIPNYPNLSWNPPVSSQGVKASPCYSWDGTSATFVADKFWQDVRKVPLTDHANPCTFKHYVSFNTFVQLQAPDGLPILVYRDDGTYPAKASSQFSPTYNILRSHPLWAERSTGFFFGNVYQGIAPARYYRLDFTPPIKTIDPLAFWPRSGPDDFPRVVDNLGQELPPWFKL